MKVKVLISQSSNADQQRLVKSIGKDVDSSLQALVAKNSEGYDIVKHQVKLTDYPQQTSTVGETTVQMVVTLTLSKKQRAENKAKPSGSAAADIRADKKKIIMGLPTPDWNYKYDVTGLEEKLTKAEYEKLKSKICNNTTGNRAVELSQLGYHFQNFLGSNLHSYEVLYPLSKHKLVDTLPMIFAITNKATKRTSYYKANKSKAKTRRV